MAQGRVPRTIGFLALGAALLVLPGPARAQVAGSLAGRWRHASGAIEIIAEFRADGGFEQVMRGPWGEERHRGRYSLEGQILRLSIDGQGDLPPIGCRFADADTIVLTYVTGEVIQAKRIAAAPAPSPVPPAPAPAPAPPPATPGAAAAPASAPPPDKPPRLLLARAWEPNERAFSVLVPGGWKTAGGMFNVDPLKTNGPGNTTAPKCDFTVKIDDRGSTMVRWFPSWNHADLTFAPAGSAGFPPGSQYRGMPVRAMPSPRQFVQELLRTERSGATGVNVVAEDAMREVSEAQAERARGMNDQLRQMGIAPVRFDSVAMLVEYTEGGQLYREAVRTTIVDSRASAFMWTNQDTVMFRAPAARFPAWKPVLDMIHASLELNPEWVSAVTKAMGERAKMALETQRYVNRIAAEIAEHRRKTNAEIRHEQWLFITGQDEYKNPFTGRVERDTSYYRYRWVNDRGEYLYTDDRSLDPNRLEEYNTKEWKLTPVWDRRS